MELESNLTDDNKGVPDGGQRILPESRPVRSDNIVSRQIGGETILVPVKTTKSELSDIFTLNEVATRTWELIDGQKNIKDIAAAIAAEYNVGQDAALRDTLELIGKLSEASAVFVPGGP